MEASTFDLVLKNSATGNARKVLSLLSCSTSGFRGSFHQPTPQVNFVFSKWVSACSEQYDNLSTDNDAVSPHSILQVILILPPSYEAPWDALVHLSETMFQLSSTQQLLCVKAVQAYLRDYIPEVELHSRWRRKCCSFLLGAVGNLVELLFVSEEHRATLDCGAFQFLHLLHRAIERVGDKGSISKCRTLVFGTMYDSMNWHHFLRRPNHLEPVHARGAIDTLANNTLAEGELSIDTVLQNFTTALELYPKALNDTNFDGGTWKQFPFRLWLQASLDPDMFVALEDRLSSKLLESVAAAELSTYWDLFCEIDNSKSLYPNHTKVRIALCFAFENCLHHLCTSTISSTMNQVLLEDRSEVSALLLRCHKMLMHLLRSDSNEDTASRSSDLSWIVPSATCYSGAGRFVDATGAKMQILSGTGVLCYNLIGLYGSPADSMAPLNAVSRWLASAERLFTNNVVDAAVLFVALSVTFYIELPSCRGTLVSSLRRLLRTGRAEEIESCLVSMYLIAGDPDSASTDRNFHETMDPFAELLKESFSDDVFDQFVEFLSQVPSARLLIFERSKGMLLGSFIKESSGPNAETPRGNSAQSGILGMLELVQGENWDRVGVLAWKVLSECLVDNSPAISLSDRDWLYAQISELAKNGSLSPRVLHHFIRATLTRVADYVSSPKSFGFNVKPSFIEGRSNKQVMVDNPANLFRLLFALLDGAVSLSEVEMEYTWQEKLQELVLVKTTTGCDFSKVFDDLKSMEEVENTHAVVTVTSTVLCRAFELLSCRTSRRASKEQDPHHKDICNVLGVIIEQEQSLFEEYVAFLPERIDPPLWIRSPGTRAWCSSVHDLGGNVRLQSVIAPMFDILIEALCSEARPWNSQFDDAGTCKELVLAVGVLLKEKKILLNGFGDMAAQVVIERATLESAAPKFFAAASSAVRTVLVNQTTIHESDTLFSAILVFCDALSSLSSEKTIVTLPLIHQRIWTLYQELGCESAAVRLVSFLESKWSTNENTRLKKADTSICSLLSISSAEDVDILVREIRYSILRGLQKCLDLSVITNPTNLIGIEIDVRHVAVQMSALTEDLRQGLEGHSGGITKEIFQAIIESIQHCVAYLHNNTKHHSWEINFGLVSSINTVASVLQSILLSYPMEDTFLFRSTLVLALAELPGTARKLTRQTTACEGLSHDFFIPEQSFLNSLFDDCYKVLVHWCNLRDPSTVPWEEITGTALGDKLHYMPLDRVKRRKSEAVAHVPLLSNTVWSWALSSIFIVFEEKWLESFRFMMSKPESIDTHAKSRVQEFLVSKRDDFIECLGLISRLFRNSGKGSEFRRSSSILEMYILNIPSAPGVRFCHFVATATKVLRFCTGELCIVLEKSIETSCAPTSRFLESLSCLSSWLLFESEEDMDFCVGTLHWLSLLQRRTAKMKDKQGENVTLFLSLVSQASMLVQDLNGELRRLRAILRRPATRVPKEFEVWFMVLLGECDPMKLSRMIAPKIEQLEASLKLVPSIGTTPKSLVPSTSQSNKRVRESNERSRKRPCNNKTLSRNRIVNAFREMDQGIVGGVVGSRDAYADLEDFLVEG